MIQIENEILDLMFLGPFFPEGIDTSLEIVDIHPGLVASLRLDNVDFSLFPLLGPHADGTNKRLKFGLGIDYILPACWGSLRSGLRPLREWRKYYPQSDEDNRRAELSER